MRRRHIVNGPTLTEVVKACDTYVARKILPGPMINGYVGVQGRYLRNFNIVFFRALRTAKWRSDPASEAQKKYVKSRWSSRKLSQSTGNDDREERIRKLTKGEAANIITRLKHGAQVGRYTSEKLSPNSLFCRHDTRKSSRQSLRSTAQQ